MVTIISKKKWNAHFPNSDKVKGVISYQLHPRRYDCRIGKKFGFHEDVDLLKMIHIDDLFDGYVIQAILDAGICPKAIIMETNVKFPLHINITFAMAPGYYKFLLIVRNVGTFMD